jgi:hypothetical protein
MKANKSLDFSAFCIYLYRIVFFRDLLRVLLVFALLALLTRCAGNGTGLDENGNPIGSDNPDLPVAFPPTFTNIQENVFNRICVACHFGANAPQGLRLDEAFAYDVLVNVASVERPELFRVRPGDPNNSYLIHKLEGGPNIVGGQMPLNISPLPQETINAFRVWISQGAQRN